MNTCQAPQAGPLSSIQELQSWSASSADPICAGWIPLQARASGLPNAPRVLHGHSDRGGYLANGDLWPQGFANSNIYLQPYWQFVDLFVYFAQTPVMIPTPWWINAAHRNGVPVLGVLCTTSFSSADMDLLLDGPPGQPTVVRAGGAAVPYFVNQLAEIASFYGFDGWFFDCENEMTAEQAKKMLSLLQTTTTVMNESGGTVIWYDALTLSGAVDYQNVLNETNLPFFLASNGIFINYWWFTGSGSSTDPSLSAALATKNGRSPFDVYTGVDVFQNNPASGQGMVGQFQTYQTVADCVAAGTSAGLFAASWTYQQATSYDDYLQRDRQLWIGTGSACEPADGIAASIPPRPIPQNLPIFTSFSMGNLIEAMWIDGAKQPGSAPFGDLSQQDLLPTWRFCARPAASASVSFDSTFAYNGGTSLLVSSVGPELVHLFLCNTLVPGELHITYNAYDPANTLSLLVTFSEGTSIVLAAEEGTDVIAPTWVVPQAGGFSTRAYALGDAFAGGTITGIDLLYAGGGVQANLGDVHIAEAPVVPAGVTSLAGTPLQGCDPTTVSTQLTWTAPSGDIAWYDVYGNNDTRIWLGRAYANTYVAQVPAGSAEILTFTVQPMSASGFRQPLASAATLSLPVPANVASA